MINYKIELNVNGDENELKGLELSYDEIVSLLQETYSKGIDGSLEFASIPRAVNPILIQLFIGITATATYDLMKWLVHRLYEFIIIHSKYQSIISIDTDYDGDNYILI